MWKTIPKEFEWITSWVMNMSHLIKRSYILRLLKISMCHSCANRNPLIIKQIPAFARMTDSLNPIFQKYHSINIYSKVTQFCRKYKKIFQNHFFESNWTIFIFHAKVGSKSLTGYYIYVLRDLFVNWTAELMWKN